MGGVDFMTPDGDQLWFNVDFTTGKDGKVSASGIDIY